MGLIIGPTSWWQSELTAETPEEKLATIGLTVEQLKVLLDL